MSKTIEHAGIVHRIYADHIEVMIIQNSACAACHAKKACTASDMAEKIIEIDTYNGNLKVGDNVTIAGSSSMGWQAVGFAFVIPFILMMSTLIFSIDYFEDELKAGILSLLVLIPYYIILFFLRKNMKQRFVFSIKE
ncbi:MAG: SoxR reducing system RseC family protein [Bacteroidales bacterium]|nr:SoxR reducing system RseC family protein [Bacteroidales bacterium]